VLTALALIAAPAFAEVQNVKVSGDINSTAVYRENYTLASTGSSNNQDQEENNFVQTAARVRIDADLTDNVMATVRFLTEYDWDTENNTANTGDDVDLDLANVTLKEAFYAPLTVIVGRQELRYGNAFVIGDPDTNTTSLDGNLTAGDLSLRKSFDSVRAIFDYNPLVVDVIWAKIDETNFNATTGMTDEDLYGINAAYDIGNYDSEIEAYWFWNDNDVPNLVAPGGADTAQSSQRTALSVHTFGVRGSIAPVEELNLLGEVAWQSGEYDSEAAVTRDQDALAYQIAADYALADIELPWTEVVLASPSIRLGYTHYSGEEVANNGDHEAWIPLYEDQSHGMVANYILGGVNGGQNSNADILNVGTTLSPLEDLSVSLDYYYFWLDENLVGADHSHAASGAPLAGNATALGWMNLTENRTFMLVDDDLGFELDLALDYDYTEDVKMGLACGWFSPGDALNGGGVVEDENNETAIQVLATLDVAF